MNIRELRDACNRAMESDPEIAEGPVYIALVPEEEGECLNIHVQVGGYAWYDVELDVGTPPGPPTFLTPGELIGTG